MADETTQEAEAPEPDTSDTVSYPDPPDDPSPDSGDDYGEDSAP